MKIINKATTRLFLVAVLLVSCNRFTSAPATMNPTDVMETAMSTVKTAVVETQAAIPSATLTASPTPYQQSTLIPTIEPEIISTLLKNSLSIETLVAFNGRNLQRIAGWSNGFSGGMWNRGSRDTGQGYLWMDSSHLLLFPVTGETPSPNWSTITTHPVVINIKTGDIWFPPTDRFFNDDRWFSIILPRWAPKLQMLVTGENIGQEEGASTFTVDGERITHYEGQLLDISPSAERIFIEGDTWIDLASGKQVDFGWGPGFGYEVHRWFPIWSRDENQIYFCCYYYGNTKTGQSYTITDGDTIFDGKPFTNSGSLGHTYGKWLNDHIVMAEYSGWWNEGTGFTAIFDVSERTYHNLGVVSGLPNTFNGYVNSHISISPNGDYMYVSQQAQSPTDPQMYLIDLKTLKSKFYHAHGADWSANGKYALIGDQVLTLSDQTLHTLPAQPDFQKSLYWIDEGWHPIEGTRVSIYADQQEHLVVGLLDVEALTYREQKFDLPSGFNGSYYSNSAGIVWDPTGNWFSLAAADGSIWLLDYPKLKNLKQLTPPLANVKDVSWSPDGQYLSYTGGTDIYIVDVGNKP